MRVLICGSRTWNDPEAIRVVVRGLVEERDAQGDLRGVDVIEGGAKGADTAGVHAAQCLGLDLLTFEADWTIGLRAGPIRNQQMLDEGKPDVVWAFCDDLGASKGTSDMVRRARKAGLPVYVVSRPG